VEIAKFVQAAAPATSNGMHYYLVLINDQGQVSDQINGFQRGTDGTLNQSGVGGTLYVASVNDGVGSAYSASSPQVVLAQGDFSTLQAQWSSGLAAGSLINGHEYSYNAFDTLGGHNSNAAANTVAIAMGLHIADLTNSMWVFAPGQTDVILSSYEIGQVAWDPNISYLPYLTTGGTPVGLVGTPHNPVA
jgi:hypothetical protein